MAQWQLYYAEPQQNGTWSARSHRKSLSRWRFGAKVLRACRPKDQFWNICDLYTRSDRIACVPCRCQNASWHSILITVRTLTERKEGRFYNVWGKKKKCNLTARVAGVLITVIQQLCEITNYTMHGLYDDFAWSPESHIIGIPLYKKLLCAIPDSRPPAESILIEITHTNTGTQIKLLQHEHKKNQEQHSCK